MIKLIIGDTVGSGKTVTGIRTLLRRNNPCFVNFDFRSKRAKRLMTDMIIKKEVTGQNRRNEDTYRYTINWEFWKNQGQGFDICIDEVQNVLDARLSMSKYNILMTQWISQIRKILSGNEKYDLILISQKLENIDVRLRRLAHSITYCEKRISPSKHKTILSNRSVKMLNKVYITNWTFSGTYCLEKFEFFLAGQKTFDRCIRWLANPYFKYYDSYQIINFGDERFV